MFQDIHVIKLNTKTMIRNIFFLIDFLFFANFAGICQQNLDTTLSLTYEQAIDTIFKALDKSKIPTGILMERSPALVQREMMDGKNPGHIISRDSILEFYSELYLGHFNFDTLLNVFVLEEIAEQ